LPYIPVCGNKPTVALNLFTTLTLSAIWLWPQVAMPSMILTGDFSTFGMNVLSAKE
jgi:hypothetical protein